MKAVEREDTGKMQSFVACNSPMAELSRNEIAGKAKNSLRNKFIFEGRSEPLARK